MQIENIEGTAISVIRAIYGAVSRGNLQITSDDPVSCALWIGATQLLHDFMQTTGIDQAEIAMNKPNAPGEGSELPAQTHRLNCASWHNDQGHEVNGEDCTCGLKYRIEAQTEQTMHAAWRKRAEEAETELAQLKAALSSPQQESAEDAWRRGWLAGYKDAVCDFNNDRSSDIRPYVTPPVTAEGKDRS